MISYESELERLRPALGGAATDRLAARERREVFSLYPELRILGWAGATLLAAAAGVVIARNLERLGPVVLTILLTAAALSCYAFVWLRRARATVVDDYILLLGALLVTADVGLIEVQFDLLGDLGKHHFLTLAVLHAIAAYLFSSRIVLSLSVAALGAWLGAHTNGGERAWPFFSASLAVLLWRGADVRLRAARVSPFARTFEHFAANYAFFGAFVLMFDNSTREVGCALAIAIAAVVIWWGFRTGTELFVLYAFVYAVIAVDVFLIDLRNDPAITLLVIVLSSIAAIGGLIALHARFREQ